MRKGWRGWATALLVVAVVLLGTVPRSEAAGRVIDLTALGYETDIAVSAPHASVTLEFPLPRLARLQSATATISLTPNLQLNADAILFFYFNDKLVETRTVKELRQRKTFTLALPVERGLQQPLRLRIKSNLFITDDLCRDYYSGGLFFTIHKESRLDLNYEMLPVRTVGDFFGSFQQSLLVVVPTDAKLAELLPAAWTYGVMKKAYPQLDVQIVRASELAGKPAAPRIWVGLRNRLPAYFAKTEAGIALADPNTLLISAATSAELATLTKQLADLPVLPVNPAASQRVTITPQESPAGKANEAIGFGNFSVQEGILSVPVDFPLYPALLGRLPERLGLHLEGAYTVSSEPAKPVRLDVFFNNSLVHSSVLDQTGQFRRDIVLPAGVELLTRNNLGIQFNYPDEPGQCRARGKMQSAQIFPNSYMWGAGQGKPAGFGWNNLGLLLTRPGMLLVDEELGGAMLRSVADTVALLNRQLPPATYAFPEALPLAQQTEIPTGRYVVVLAMHKNIPPFLQERMPIALGNDFTLLRKENQTSRFEYQANVNSVVGRLGEHKQLPLLILSVNQAASLLAEALHQLNRASRYEQLEGNVLVYSQPNRLYSFDIRDKGLVVEQPAAKGMAAKLWGENRQLLIALAALLALLVLCLVFFSHLRSRRTPPTPPQNRS